MFVVLVAGSMLFILTGCAEVPHRHGRYSYYHEPYYYYPYESYYWVGYTEPRYQRRIEIKRHRKYHRTMKRTSFHQNASSKARNMPVRDSEKHKGHGKHGKR